MFRKFDLVLISDIENRVVIFDWLLSKYYSNCIQITEMNLKEMCCCCYGVILTLDSLQIIFPCKVI